MLSVLIPEDVLAPLDYAVSRRLAETEHTYWIDPANPNYGHEFRRFVLLEYFTNLLPDSIQNDHLLIQYNKLYWVRRLAHRMETIHGSDAGMKQLVFKTIEQFDRIDGEVDWNVIEAINMLAESG